MTTTTHVPLSLILAIAAGCATEASYLYAPQDAHVWSDGYPTASIEVPPEAPQGKVNITSFGITEITPDGSGPVAALHVRLAVTNEGDATPWTLDTTNQLVEIPGEGKSRPIFVNTDIRTLPAVTIAQRERRILDFYYPLPVGIRDEEHLAGFDVIWQVTTAARTYASRTQFQRVEEEPATTTPQVVYWSGWGPYWWYDPMYASVVFVHHTPPFVYRGPHVRVTHPPRLHYRAVRDHRH